MTNKQIRQIIASPTQVLVSDGINPESNLGYYDLSSIGKDLLGVTTTSQGQEALSLVPGTHVQAYDSDLEAIASLSTTGAIERTGAGTAATFTVTNSAKQLLDDSSFASMRTTLELGSISTQSANNVSITGGSVTGITDLAVADGGTGASTAADARTNLGLMIGTNVQAHSANLTTLAGLSFSTGNFIVGNGITWAVQSGSTARTSLGLGAAATQTYEKGSWTPTIVGSVTPGTATYTTFRVGTYLRIGDLIQIQLTVSWTGGTGTGDVFVTGLPFASSAVANNFSTASGVVLSASVPAGYLPFFQISPGQSQIGLFSFEVGGSGVAGLAYPSAGLLTVSMSYQI